MARRLWKLKLTVLIILLLLIGIVIALFPLQVLRWKKTEAREISLGLHWEELPLIGRFYPPPKEIPIEQQPTLELQVVAQQRRDLEIRENKYREEVERVQKAKEDLENQRQELKKIRDELEVLIGSKEQMQSGEFMEKDKKSAAMLAQLAKSYEKMDPTIAAKTLSAMEDTDVIKILSKIREKNVSRIIEAMEPGRAAQISAGIINAK